MLNLVELRLISVRVNTNTARIKRTKKIPLSQEQQQNLRNFFLALSFPFLKFNGEKSQKTVLKTFHAALPESE